MSEPTSPAPPQADELAKQLQTALKQRRPRPWLALLASLVLACAGLGIVAILMYPRSAPDMLLVVALDGLFAPDEVVKARAQLLLPGQDQDRRRLRDQTIDFFDQPAVARPGRQLRDAKVQSDANGQASVDWPIERPATMTEVLVRYLNVEHRQVGVPDVGRLFVWPKDAMVLVVDADEMLIGEPPDEVAQAALDKAAEDGWRVVYLSLASADANEFRVARGLIQAQRLPLGPVLGRSSYPSEQTVDQARREALESLQGRFRGPTVAVVKSTAAAAAANERKIRTILIGAAERPAGVLEAATWAEVPAQLK